MQNLSAPFICEVPPFKAVLVAALKKADFLFGNETEAAVFAKTEGWETTDVAVIASKISKTYSSEKPLTVVRFTATLLGRLCDTTGRDVNQHESSRDPSQSSHRAMLSTEQCRTAHSTHSTQTASSQVSSVPTSCASSAGPGAPSTSAPCARCGR